MNHIALFDEETGECIGVLQASDENLIRVNSGGPHIVQHSLQGGIMDARHLRLNKQTGEIERYSEEQGSLMELPSAILLPGNQSSMT